MKPLRVAIVGCGFMGRMHANVYGQLEGAELCAAVDKKQAALDKFHKDFGVKGYLSFEEMTATEDPDIVDICLPTYLHKEFTILSAIAGKHVMCEKPIALNTRDASEMINACTEAGVKLMIGHCIRFWPEYVLLKEVVDSKRLGKLLSLNLTRLGEFPSWSSDNWLADESKSGGGVVDMHIHDTDYAMFLLGLPRSVSSFGTVDETGPAFAFTTMDYRECVIHTEGGWNLPVGTPFKMTFRAIFERGVVFWENGPMTIIEQGKAPEIPEFPKMKASGGGNISDLGGYYHELKYFVDCVREDKPIEMAPPYSSMFSLGNVLEEVRQIKSRLKNGFAELLPKLEEVFDYSLPDMIDLQKWDAESIYDFARGYSKYEGASPRLHIQAFLEILRRVGVDPNDLILGEFDLCFALENLFDDVSLDGTHAMGTTQRVHGGGAKEFAGLFDWMSCAQLKVTLEWMEIAEDLTKGRFSRHDDDFLEGWREYVKVRCASEA